MNTSLARKVQNCLRNFDALLSVVQGCGPSLPHYVATTISGETGKLFDWSIKLGATAHGEYSLEYTLRDAKNFKIDIVNNITELGNRAIYLRGLLSNNPDPSTVFVNKIVKQIELYASCLYVKEPLFRQRIRDDLMHWLQSKGATSVNIEGYEREQVLRRFPHVDPKLAGRLGSATFLRIAYAEYRKRCRYGPRLSTLPVADWGIVEFGVGSSSAPQAIDASVDHNPDSLLVPAPPTRDHPFQCPYCRADIKAGSIKDWE